MLTCVTSRNRDFPHSLLWEKRALVLLHHSLTELFPCSASGRDRTTSPPVGCDCFMFSFPLNGMSGLASLEPNAAPQRARRARASVRTAASCRGNHTKMGFNGPSIERLSKANLWPSALTPANPAHPPGSSICHWSFVKPLCTDLITAQFGSADYTLLGSGQASFSNFTWQQIAGLLREE